MKDLTVAQISKAIMSNGFSNEDLVIIADAVKSRRERLAFINKKVISVGEHVSFNSQKYGRKITGQVTKIARKFLTIREHGYNHGNWKVPAFMVEVM